VDRIFTLRNTVKLTPVISRKNEALRLDNSRFSQNATVLGLTLVRPRQTGWMCHCKTWPRSGFVSGASIRLASIIQHFANGSSKSSAGKDPVVPIDP
jgi:hypothetical protein